MEPEQMLEKLYQKPVQKKPGQYRTKMGEWEMRFHVEQARTTILEEALAEILEDVPLPEPIAQKVTQLLA